MKTLTARRPARSGYGGAEVSGDGDGEGESLGLGLGESVGEGVGVGGGGGGTVPSRSAMSFWICTISLGVNHAG
jgi:hypothetical protein